MAKTREEIDAERDEMFQRFLAIEAETGGNLSLTELAERLGTTKPAAHRLRLKHRQRTGTGKPVKIGVLLDQSIYRKFKRVCRREGLSIADSLRTMIAAKVKSSSLPKEGADQPK
jgi:hypothetical protein